MRAVSSLTALTSLELWGCSEVTDERMEHAEHLPAHVQRTKAGLSRSCIVSEYVPKLL
jgi:hypothetical protein